MPAPQVLPVEQRHSTRGAGAGQDAPHLLARRRPRSILWFGQPPETLHGLVQVTGHQRVVDVLEAGQPPHVHHGLVLLEHRDGARMLPVLLQGRHELGEHRCSARRQFERACQRPDSQVSGAALGTRVTEVVQRLHVAGTGAVPALCRRGGLREVIEPGEPRSSRYQPRHLAQRQRLAVRAQVPQQTGDVAGRQQALCLLKLPSHAHTLTKRPRAPSAFRRAVINRNNSDAPPIWVRLRQDGAGTGGTVGEVDGPNSLRIRNQ